MPDPRATPERDVMRRWVEIWGRAGEELGEIRRRELELTDTREAIRQIFSSAEIFPTRPSDTSGLVEQQAWFARLRR
jgi:hypothetical protein